MISSNLVVNPCINRAYINTLIFLTTIVYPECNSKIPLQIAAHFLKPCSKLYFDSSICKIHAFYPGKCWFIKFLLPQHFS